MTSLQFNSVKLRVVALCLVVVAMVVVSHQASSVEALGGHLPLQGTYLIKGKLIRNLWEAVTQMRRFVPARQEKSERCKRFVVLLKTLKTSNMDNFQIAGLGLSPVKEIESKFDHIVVDEVVDLYIRGIQSFIQSQRFDDGALELYNCLYNGYHARDAKARSFLNDNQLKLIKEQYEFLSSQPLSMVLEPENFKLPNLAFKDLQPIMKTYVLNLFYGDKAKAVLPFADAGQSQNLAETPPGSPSSAASEQAAEETLAYEPTASVEPEPVVQPKAEETDEVASVKGENSYSMEDQIQMAEKSDRFFQLLFAGVARIYNTLPLSAKLGDRCEAYNFAVKASEEDLSQDTFFEKLVEAAKQHIEKAGANEVVSLPNEQERQNFLQAASFAADFMPDSDEAAMSDLYECVLELSK